MGIPRFAVVSTLKAAEEFVRTLDLGEATTKVLDEWKMRARPYEALESDEIGDAKAMKKAVDQAGLRWIFLRMHELFRSHALMDTDGLARKLYRDMSRLNMFTGVTLADYRKTDFEEDLHLVLKYAEIVRSEPSGTIMVRLKTYLEADADEENSGFTDALMLVDSVPENISLSWDDVFSAGKIEALFRGYDLFGRRQMKELLFALSGLPDRESALETKIPYRRYGIKMSREEGQNRVYKSLQDEFMRVAAPFLETDEAEYCVAYGIITRPVSAEAPIGICFMGTEGFAQAVAEAFPDREVIDSGGSVVIPVRALPVPTVCG